MKVWHTLSDRIDLHVADRIPESDARRQQQTAAALLERLADRPGVILADEVGMGKTFVALAVAASVALSDREQRPVVVMVPPSLRKKWPTDFSLFREKCLKGMGGDAHARKLDHGEADRAVEFLKLIDDPPERRKSILFVTHGAMSRGLRDGWVRLALLRTAMRWKPDAGLRRAVGRFAGQLLQIPRADSFDPGLWERLLDAPPKRWMKLLREAGVTDCDDDPVPEAIVNAFDRLDSRELNALYEALAAAMPRHNRGDMKERIKAARHVISDKLRTVWKDCLRRLQLRLPLLILDEAHHLKNGQTQLASLFHSPEAIEDADEVTRGELGGVFERMLFLTATPFQLGHHELCSVLERFDGIDWTSAASPSLERTQCGEELVELRRSLDQAQHAALSFDAAWGQLREEDLGGWSHQAVDGWWNGVGKSPVESSNVRIVVNACERTRELFKAAEARLRPWVVRHLKSRQLPAPNGHVQRRERLSGRAILDEVGQDVGGIPIAGESLLPFLLAARAAALMPESRPVFAEGLASSYEAFLHTRQSNRRRKGELEDSPIDTDDEIVSRTDPSTEMRWYLDQLQSLMPLDGPGEIPHPKVSATVNRAVGIWRSGEKVLIFCHYIATGRILRQRISDAIDRELTCMAATKLRCPESEAVDTLERIGNRFFDADSPLRRASDERIASLLDGFPALFRHRDSLIAIVRSNLRTPSFLARHFPIDREALGVGEVSEAFSARDGSGVPLQETLHDFFRFLDRRCGAEERESYIEAARRVQTGSHRGEEVRESYSSEELSADPSQKLVPNVRLVNGATRQETRQRLMRTFNTPFYPEILIASSVMAEGVDLHLNCRHIIHHDLCWNPSTLEQRIGRVDRIGARVERCGQPIRIYLPFVAGTQDEKMHRVVLDRERWFNIVMGDKVPVDARTTDKLAERVPLPLSIAESLQFRLEATDDRRT